MTFVETIRGIGAPASECGRSVHVTVVIAPSRGIRVREPLSRRPVIASYRSGSSLRAAREISFPGRFPACGPRTFGARLSDSSLSLSLSPGLCSQGADGRPRRGRARARGGTAGTIARNRAESRNATTQTPRPCGEPSVFWHKPRVLA